MGKEKSSLWSVSGKYIMRPLSEKEKGNFRPMKNLGISVGLRKSTVCCSGNFKLLMFKKNCWSINFKDNDMVIDVGKMHKALL